MPNPRMIGFGEDLAFMGVAGSPFNGIPLRFAAFLKRHIGIAIGNGEYNGPAAAGTENGVVVTDIAGTGAVTVDTEGRLVITTGTTDENRTQIQFKRPQFSGLAASRRLVFGARFKVSTAATTDLLIGLASVDTTVVTAAAGAVDVDDGLFFIKLATATDLTFEAIVNSSAVTSAMGLTILDDTFMVVAFVVENNTIRGYAFMDPNDKIAYINDASAASFGTAVSLAATNLPNDTDMCLTIIAGQEGGTTARVVTVDWAFVSQEHA